MEIENPDPDPRAIVAIAVGLARNRHGKVAGVDPDRLGKVVVDVLILAPGLGLGRGNAALDGIDLLGLVSGLPLVLPLRGAILSDSM